MRRGRRHRAAIPHPHHLRHARHPTGDWHLFADWADDIFKVFEWNIVNDEPDILRAWNALEDYLDLMVTRRRDSLGDDLLSDLSVQRSR